MSAQPDPATMTSEELRAESARFHAHKAWCSRQASVDAELHRRSVSEWRQFDVFGGPVR